MDYGERLYLNFTREMRTGDGPIPIGKVLVRAKQGYLADTAVVIDGIFKKSVLIATMIGLLMQRIDMQGSRIVPAEPLSEVPTLTPVPPGSPGEAYALRTSNLTVTPQVTISTKTMTNITDGSTFTATYGVGPDGSAARPG